MYKHYLFDLYGTLIDIHTNEEALPLWQKLSSFYAFNGALYTATTLKEAYIEIVSSYKANCTFQCPKRIHLKGNAYLRY